MSQYTMSYNTYGTKKSLSRKQYTFHRLFIVDLNMSLKQLYLEVFKFNRVLFEEYGILGLKQKEIEEMEDQELFDRVFGYNTPGNMEVEKTVPYELRFLNKY